MSKLDSQLKERYGEYIGYFKDLIALRSVAAYSKNEIHETAKYLSKLLSKKDFTVDVIEGYGNPIIYAYREGRGKRLLIYNHYDVQPVEPLELWDSNPFNLVERNGLLIGRGVADNKGNIIARLMAIDIYSEIHGVDKPITWIIEGEEEIGSPNLDKFVNDKRGMLRGNGGIWETGYVRPDDRLSFTLGFKGMIYLEIRIRRMNVDAHSGYAPILPNAVIDLSQLITRLKKPNGEILFKNLYKGIDPEYIAIAREIARDFPVDDIGKLKEVLDINDFVSGLKDREAFLKIVTEPSLNICGVYGGYTKEGSKTIVPSEAVAKIDMRPLPGQDPNKILNDFTEYLKEIGYGDVEVKVHSIYRSGYTRPDAEIVRVAKESAVNAYGAPAVVSPMSGGSGPIYLFTDVANVPMAGAGVGYYGSKAHAPNENIRVRDFLKGVKHFYYILENFLV